MCGLRWRLAISLCAIACACMIQSHSSADEPVATMPRPQPAVKAAAGGTSFASDAAASRTNAAPRPSVVYTPEIPQPGRAATGPSPLRPLPMRLVNGRMQEGEGPGGQPIVPQPIVPQPNQPTSQPIVPQPGANTGASARQVSGTGLDLYAPSGGSSIRMDTFELTMPQNNVPATSSVTGETVRSQARPDIVSALKDSTTQQTVSAQMRNPISFDPRVRGYRYGQIYSQIDGAEWVPGRQDLDTPLSMISPNIVDTAIAIPGPYGTQYGPGFSFLGVNTADTPRYSQGAEVHADLGINYITNGDQVNAYERFYGGGDRQGFSVFHNSRHGNAYRAGNGQYIPAAYNSQNFFGQYGWNIDRFTKLEFRYLRQDITNTQIPGQFYQLDFNGTNGFNLRLTNDNPNSFWTRSTTEGWYNQTYYNGSTNPSETYFNVVGRVNLALTDFYNGLGFAGQVTDFRSATTGNTIITGGRYTGVLGDDDDPQIITGGDYRYVQQLITERTTWTPPPTSPSPPQDVSTFLPNSYMTDPGVFLNLKIPVNTFWTTTFGSRFDFIQTAAFDRNFDPDTFGPEPLQKYNRLYTLFVNNKIDISPNWSSQIAFSSAQRPPTLTERYADNIFIAVAQDGFTKVIGNPQQSPEHAYQMDLTLQANYDNFRGRWSGFGSWITSFSTFSVQPVVDPTGARTFFTTTTPLASLAGTEMYVEGDLTSNLTAFGNVFYLTGRDLTLAQPLIQIYPLDSRVGIRMHDSNRGSKWAVEVYERMVSAQHQLGTLRQTDGGLYIAEFETPGFAITNISAYYNYSERLSFVGGINNLLDQNYLEHLSLRLASQGPFPAASVFSPGFAAYMGANCTF